MFDGFTLVKNRPTEQTWHRPSAAFPGALVSVVYNSGYLPAHLAYSVAVVFRNPKTKLLVGVYKHPLTNEEQAKKLCEKLAGTWARDFVPVNSASDHTAQLTITDEYGVGVGDNPSHMHLRTALYSLQGPYVYSGVSLNQQPVFVVQLKLRLGRHGAHRSYVLFDGERYTPLRVLSLSRRAIKGEEMPMFVLSPVLLGASQCSQVLVRNVALTTDDAQGFIEAARTVIVPEAKA